MSNKTIVDPQFYIYEDGIFHVGAFALPEDTLHGVRRTHCVKGLVISARSLGEAVDTFKMFVERATSEKFQIDRVKELSNFLDKSPS